MSRSINITNSKKRDAEVAIESPHYTKAVTYALPDGGEFKTVKLLKNTILTTEAALLKKYGGDPVKLGEAIIETDPEIDFEQTGRVLKNTHRLYVDGDSKAVYRVNLFQVKRGIHGEETERAPLERKASNISVEGLPVQWTGKKIPKNEAVRRFVFTRQYQIKHISGLTYDFLYEMAKELQESDSLTRVGAGEKGADALRFTSGGEPYIGFLEGRVEGDKYMLILHLTNMELKEVPNA